MLTREEAKEAIEIGKKEIYPYSIEDNVDEIIDKIYDEHEAQLKEAEFAITVLNKNLKLNSELLKAKDEDISRLKHIIGVRPKGAYAQISLDIGDRHARRYFTETEYWSCNVFVDVVAYEVMKMFYNMKDTQC